MRSRKEVVVAVAVALVVAVAVAAMLPGADAAKKRKGKRSSHLMSSAEKKLNEKCKNCKKIVEEFFDGIEKTETDIEFTGKSKGWSKDNEKFLGKYSMGEARMAAALENVCGKDYKCNSLFEDLEEKIEEWWMEIADENSTEDDLFHWMCIDETKFCCSDGTFGTNCNPCILVSGNVCGGHGECSGDGYRTGTGKCKCKDNFSGKDCTKCKKGFFLHQSSSSLVMSCEKCDDACKLNCKGPGPEHCEECKEGYELVDGSCRDINECETDDNICTEKDNVFCLNTPGSFDCSPCNVACVDTCSGPAPDHCNSCNEGFATLPTGGCEDIDECKQDDICNEAGQFCSNTPGSYACLSCNNKCKQCIGAAPNECSLCNEGYELNTQNGQETGECEDINECKLFPCNEAETCVNKDGSHSCSCNFPASVCVCSNTHCPRSLWFCRVCFSSVIWSFCYSFPIRSFACCRLKTLPMSVLFQIHFQMPLLLKIPKQMSHSSSSNKTNWPLHQHKNLIFRRLMGI
eukprot:m.175175 g.175175  ORF g.175175 m.175175 type:complete len:516 (+) comp13511_c0_seq2:100-1647(+)